MTTGDFWLGLGLGLALSAVAFAALQWSFRRLVRRRELSRSRPPATSPVHPPAIVPGLAPVRAIPLPDPPAPTPAHPVPNGLPVAASPLPDDPLARPDPPIFAPITPPIPDPALIDPDENPVRLSQRVLIHLARRGGVAGAGSADEALTQRGIGAALGVTQGALSSVLGRLEDGGAIASEKTHVKGRDRRVKIYLLTPRGRELAARLPPTGASLSAASVVAPKRPAPTARAQ